MLDSLRDIAKTWIGKVIGAFLLVGLAGFGISGVISGIGSSTVARIGSEEITTREFQRAYSTQLNAAAQRTGAVPTSQQALAMGIPSAVINRLASDAALNAMGKDFGLGASDAHLGELLREDPNFGGTLGDFSSDNFERLLQQSGMTEKEYFNSQIEAARRQQIALGIFAGVKAPDAALKLINRYGTDTRTIDYFIVSAENMLPPADPTDEEIAEYLTANQSSYRTVPTRKAQVMVLSPEAIAAGIELTEDEVAAEYERTKASYVKIETRDVRQVILSSDILMRWFEMGLETGKTFDAIIEESGLPVTELGSLTKAQITDDQLAEAAFSVGEGEYKLIPGAQGTRAVSVSKIVEGGQTPFEEAREEISNKLKTRHARDSYIDILDQIEELRAAFRPTAEIAQRYSLDLVEVSLSADGSALEAVTSIPEDGRSRIAVAIFAAEEGSLAPTVALGANRNVWFDILSVEPSRDQTLDEVGDAIREQMLAERVDAELATLVDQIVATLGTGQPFADVAISNQLILQQSEPLNRGGNGGASFSPQVIAAAFGGGTGHFGSARNTDGNYVVFHVSDVTAGTEERIEASRDFIQNSILDSIYSEFIGGLRDETGLKINNQVLSQLLAIDANGNPQ